jgi:drug/metabolite transporter (DMT)-like permease
MSVPYGGTVMTGNSIRALVSRTSQRPVLTATLGATCISSSAILVTLSHAGPVTVAFYRSAFALVALIPLAVVEQRRHGARPLASRGYAVLAGLFLAVDLVLWNHAIADVGAGVATVLGNLQVLFVGVFAWLVLGERPSRRYLVMLPVVLLGVVLVSGMLGGHAAGLHPAAGALFGLGTSAAYACFLLIMRGTGGDSQHVAGQLADATAGAAIGSLLIALFVGGMHFSLPLPSFAWLVLLALLSGTIGWLLITSSLPKLPAAISSLLLLLQPAATMVLAAFVLDERPTLVQLLGAVLTCCAVLAVSLSRAESKTDRGGPGERKAGRARSGLHPEQHVAVAEAGSGRISP